MVTGATGALGLEVASDLARHGNRVVLLGRDRTRLRRARWHIAQAAPDRAAEVEVLMCDLASMASIRAAAAMVTASRGAVHALVHCAGVFSAARRTSADGYELMVATNHLAPALLTLLLRDALLAARSGRVVFVTPAHGRAPRLEDPLSLRSFASLEAFTRSKQMSLSFASQLAQRWRGSVSVFAADPGQTRSGLLREAPLQLRAALAVFAGSPEKTKRPIVHAALSPALEGTTGVCFRHRGADSLMSGADTEVQLKLWDLTVALLGWGAPVGIAAA